LIDDYVKSAGVEEAYLGNVVSLETKFTKEEGGTESDGVNRIDFHWVQHAISRGKLDTTYGT
jgi:hypothetical protein